MTPLNPLSSEDLEDLEELVGLGEVDEQLLEGPGPLFDEQQLLQILDPSHNDRAPSCASTLTAASPSPSLSTSSPSSPPPPLRRSSRATARPARPRSQSSPQLPHPPSAESGIQTGKRRKSAPAQVHGAANGLLAQTSETRLRALEVQLDRILHTERRLKELGESLGAVQELCNVNASWRHINDSANATSRADVDKRLYEMTSKLDALSVNTHSRIDEIAHRLDALCEKVSTQKHSALGHLNVSCAPAIGLAFGGGPTYGIAYQAYEHHCTTAPHPRVLLGTSRHVP